MWLVVAKYWFKKVIQGCVNYVNHSMSIMFALIIWHVSRTNQSLRHLTCLPYLRESCWNFSWGPKLSHFFHIFTHWYVTLHLWVCTFSIAGMPLFTRGYVTVHPWVCHFSHAGMSPFFCGYTAFHPRACHLLLVGVSLFTLGLITFHSWVCHLSLARMISSSRGYVTFRSRICHPSLVGMSPFNSSTADLPKHTRNLFFCNKAFILVSRSLLFSFTHVNNVFFSHASLTNVTKKWSASNCDLKTPSRAARIWNPKFECNEAWNPSNGKSLRSWPQPWENSPARWVHQKVVAWWITRRLSFFNFSVLLECKTNPIIWFDRDSFG